MTIERDWKRMRLAQAQPYWVLGLLPLEHIEDMAVNDMLAGREGYALAVLAGGHLEDYELDDFLRAALAEAGIPSMDRCAAIRAVAKEILDDMTARRVTPLVGAIALAELDPDGEVPEVRRWEFSGLADEAEGFAELDPREWNPEWGPLSTLAGGEADIMRLVREVRPRLDRTH